MKQTYCLLFLIVSSIGYGQPLYQLSGTVTDQNNALIKTGDAYLFFLENKNPVQHTTLSEGAFNFNNIKAGEYKISVISMGYQKKIKRLKIDSNKTIQILLKDNTITLNEITLKTKKKAISLKDGNLKINLENSIFKSLSSPIAILSQLPEIQISSNQESISIIGKGNPLIYLDNQRINFDQLKSIAIEHIKSIEIIDNPSAKYDADGRSLLLITQKHNRIDGSSFTISEIASFKRKFSNYIGFNSNFKKNRLELKANFNYNQLGFWESAASKLIIPFQNITSQQKTTVTGPRLQFIAGSGIFYQLNTDEYISVQVNLRSQSGNFPLQTTSFFTKDTKTDLILTQSLDEESRNFISSNINFNKKFTKTSSIFFGTQYSYYVRNLKNEISNTINQIEIKSSEDRNQSYKIGVFAAKIDFEKKVNDHMKLDIGGNLSHSDALAFSDFKSKKNTDTSIISTYDYNEDLYASYIELSGTINKIKYTAGVRSETNIVTGSFRDSLDLLIDRKQTQLFPKTTIKIPIDSTKTITLNYTTTIQRPGYLNASSISTFINPFVEFSRNVNLKPTLTQEVSSSFILKKSEINLSYFYSKNPIFYSVKFNPLVNKIISSPENFRQESGYRIRLRNTNTYRFWNTTNTATLTYNNIKDVTAVHKKVHPYLYYHSNNEFKIASKTTFGIQFWGLTSRNEGIFKRNSLFILGTSFSTTFLKKFNITVHANDIFKNMNYKDSYTINNITSDNFFYVNAKEISFSITYSFNTLKKSIFKNKNVDDNLNRL
ncbi:outer membrane beta-barrel family protein [Aquimarina longa]|uniref:outer membrane beta-barrel family protein n=1 Tax=Aquimarina longa TaxID=1080221 RepID=UPI00078069F4|nr:outer membrane beta-barrel family protein [Aquimarina longa]